VSGESGEVAGQRAPDVAPGATAAEGPDTAALPTDASLRTDAAAGAGREAVAAARDGLAAADLLALLTGVFPPGARAAHWGACLDTIGPLAAGIPADLTGWTEGRAWSARAELRWQQASDGTYRALYLGEAGAAPAGFTLLAADLRAVVAADAPGLLLWGARGSDGQYHAARLPRPLDYPAVASLGLASADSGAPSVSCELLLGHDGAVRWVRLALSEEA